MHSYPVKVDRSAGSTLTVMKIYKFSATARFVRFVLPSFQKPGGEQPVYKAELYGCPDEGKTNGKGKKGTDNRQDCLSSASTLSTLELKGKRHTQSIEQLCMRNVLTRS